jgi:hypothetical protein
MHLPDVGDIKIILKATGDLEYPGAEMRSDGNVRQWRVYSAADGFLQD